MAILKTEYEVFLSFRGYDTRQGFTDVLYNHLIESGIQVFRDDDELAIGDMIELILDAIGNSKICVPIFSKSFASSAWCLREVAKMVELNKVIVPIFYDVTVDDVKLKTPLYVDHLKVHQQKHGKEQVEKWEKALVEVARIKGRRLKKDMGFSKFNKQITVEILLKLGGKQKFTTYRYVEMIDQTKAAMDLLDIQSADVRFLWLYGMGGIGKTTLAKTIFNRISSSFDACSFLANIREECSTSKGLEYLQTKLLQDVNPKASSDIISRIGWANIMNSSLSRKTVLIVLDDVSEISHIRELIGELSFCSGSRIIVTTRDERVVTKFMQTSSSSDEVRTKVSPHIASMEIKGMNPKQAMQLFSGHAFGTDSPPQDYLSLSNDVVSISAGLPLALEVMGSLLCGMSIQSWIAKISQLKKIPAERVQEKLMISYEALEDDEKKIFLDIACFFINQETSHPTYMWEACDFCPDWAVPVLLSMSLVKIKYGKFWMHDQLRDLGRDIVKRGSKDDITQQSRLWERDDILEVLKCKKKKKNTEAIQLLQYDTDYTHYEFSGFDNLRFLVLDRPNHQQTISGTLPKLRWLSLKGAFEVGNLVVPNVGAIHLSELGVDENWVGWNQICGLKLKSLKIRDNLRGTPLFTQNMLALERLDLAVCIHLAYIDSSIILLGNLTTLKLSHCSSLSKLPEELGCLGSLTTLDLAYCRHLSEMPESLGDLHSLRKLNLTGTSISSLPDSIGGLQKLECLNLMLCQSLMSLPETLGNLHSLTKLDLTRTRITNFPNSIGGLEKLEFLSLDSPLTSLPDSFGNLRSLVELDLSYSEISELPSTISQLSHLQILKLSNCYHLRELPELPTSLRKLKIRLFALNKLDDLSNLQQLTSLKLTVGDIFDEEGDILNPWDGDRIFDWYGSFPGKLRSLSIKLFSTSRLPDLSNCSQLTKFELQCERSLKVLPDLSALRKLETLKIESCEELIEIPGIGELKELRSLEIIGCGMLKEIPGLGGLRSLTNLRVENCSSLERLDDISGLEELEQFTVYGCQKLNSPERLVDVPSDHTDHQELMDGSSLDHRHHQELALDMSPDYPQDELDLNLPYPEDDLDLNLPYPQDELDLNLPYPQDERATEQSEASNFLGEDNRRKRGMDWLDSLEEGPVKLRLLDISDDLSLRFGTQ